LTTVSKKHCLVFFWQKKGTKTTSGPVAHKHKKSGFVGLLISLFIPKVEEEEEERRKKTRR